MLDRVFSVFRLTKKPLHLGRSDCRKSHFSGFLGAAPLSGGRAEPRTSLPPLSQRGVFIQTDRSIWGGLGFTDNGAIKKASLAERLSYF